MSLQAVGAVAMTAAALSTAWYLMWRCVLRPMPLVRAICGIDRDKNT